MDEKEVLITWELDDSPKLHYCVSNLDAQLMADLTSLEKLDLTKKDISLVHLDSI